MTNEELKELMQDTWTFTRTDCEGITTSRTFHSETWPFALQQFVNFLKQDFGVDDDSIGINSDKHLISWNTSEETGWYGNLFSTEDK